MKTHTLFCLLLVIPLLSQVKAQDQFYIKAAPNGEVTVRGEIFGEITFDNGVKVGTYWNYEGAIFLVQYDIQGNVKWVKDFTGNYSDFSGYSGLEIDKSSNIYMIGTFTDSVAFDSVNHLVSTATQRPDYGQKGYLVKFDPQGNFGWALHPEGATQSRFFQVKTDSNNHIYVHGAYSGSEISFGDLPPLSSNGSTEEQFVAKFNAEGKPIWLRSVDMYTRDGSRHYINDFEIDDAGNTYFAGGFRGDRADNLVFGNLGLTGHPTLFEIFLTKVDPMGNPLWLKKVRTEGRSDFPRQLAVNVEGDIYLSGQYGQSSTFGSLPSISTIFEDAFVAQFDAEGEAQWVRGTSTSNRGANRPMAMSLSGNGDIFSSGTFYEPVEFPPLAPISSDTGRVYLVKHDNTGNAVCAFNTSQEIQDISTDHLSNVFTVAFRGWRYNGPEPIFIVTKWGENCNKVWENSADVFVIGSVKDPLPQSFANTYPNPAYQTLNIELTEMLTAPAQLELHDISGKLLHQEQIQSGTQQKKLDMSAWQSGMYLLRIITEEGTLNRKIIKN